MRRVCLIRLARLKICFKIHIQQGSFCVLVIKKSQLISVHLSFYHAIKNTSCGEKERLI